MSILPARARSPWHPVYRRRFRAALFVLLGQHVFEQLSNNDRALVESKADEINKEIHGEIPYRVRQRNVGVNAGEDWRSAWRARAMAVLRIPTGVVALTWEDLSSGVGSHNPVHELLAFRRFHRATDDAVSFLREHGMELDERAAQGHDWLDTMRHRFP